MKKSYNAGKANPSYKDGRVGDSGHAMTLRLPPNAAENLKRMAEAAGVSRNEFIVRLLTAAGESE